MKKLAFLFLIITISITAQTDQKIYDIIENVSEERLKKPFLILVELVLQDVGLKKSSMTSPKNVKIV
jgi:hypothetical protein